MNKQERSYLKNNWELHKERLKNVDYKDAIDISNNCYVEFGLCGIAVIKHIKGKWYRKIINYWKELSYEQFIKEYDEQEWEML